MERAEAEAIYDAGREACVQFILDLAARVEAAGGAVESVGGPGASGFAHEFEAAVVGSAEDAGAAAGGGAREGEGVDARGRASSARRAVSRAIAGAGRELRPEDQIDEIVDHYPDACGGCGRAFAASERLPRRRFGRHQVAELPPISVIWTEHRTHQLRCPECRARTSARLPDGIGGLRVRAEVAGGGRDFDRPAPCLAPRDLRARA